MILRRTALVVCLATASAAAAEPYDHQALLRTLGFSAGQAAACGIDTREKTKTVAEGLAAIMGYRDENTKTLLAQMADASSKRGCLWTLRNGEVDPEFRAQWARQKRRLAIE